MLVRLLLLSIIPFLLFATTDRSLQRMKIEQRVALVIGNNNYDSSKLLKLKNPVNDARAMKNKLKKLGFKVYYGENLTVRQMDKKLDKFSQKLKAGGVGLFFFAGHGIEYNNQNYLMAKNSNINDKNDVKYESLPLRKILDNMEDSGNRLNIVLLDACRNDPFSRSSGGGLAKTAARGTFIVYATSPGDVASDGSGKHGAFTSEILKHIDAQGVPIERVFKRVKVGVINSTNQSQRPWTNSDITGDFYFRLPSKTLNEFKVQKKQNTSSDVTILMSVKNKHQKLKIGEKEFWQEVKKENTKEYYEMYLTEYQNGYYSMDAKKIIAQQEAEKLELVKDKGKQAWKNIKNSTYGSDFEAFLKSYPKGVNARLARLKVKKYQHNIRISDFFVHIKAGSFQMGSDSGDNDEKPVHRVTIEYDFYLGKYEVTFNEYDKFCEDTGRKKTSDEGWGRGNRPVINVSWNDAKAYTNWLSQKTGQTYRLPTEAEWEYVARAGTTTKYSFGNSESNLNNYAWYEANSNLRTHEVGKKQANLWGVYDMYGNVWEWSSNWYSSRYQNMSKEKSEESNGSQKRVLRGGSWYNDSNKLRSSNRIWANSSEVDRDSGFRLILIP